MRPGRSDTIVNTAPAGFAKPAFRPFGGRKGRDVFRTADHHIIGGHFDPQIDTTRPFAAHVAMTGPCVGDRGRDFVVNSATQAASGIGHDVFLSWQCAALSAQRQRKRQRTGYTTIITPTPKSPNSARRPFRPSDRSQSMRSKDTLLSGPPNPAFHPRNMCQARHSASDLHPTRPT